MCYCDIFVGPHWPGLFLGEAILSPESLLLILVEEGEEGRLSVFNPTSFNKLLAEASSCSFFLEPNEYNSGGHH